MTNKAEICWQKRIYCKFTNCFHNICKFIDYRTGMASNELPLPSTAYWHSLESVLTSYVRHDDYKFDYIDNKAVRKHIFADRIRYIGKESNNLDESLVFGIDDNSYLEYANPEAVQLPEAYKSGDDKRLPGIPLKIILSQS